MELLGGMSRYLSVPLAAVGVSALVLRESFRHVEHFLLALSSVFVAYVVSGVLAHPDWGAAAKGLVVPSLPLNREAVLVAVATVGTTLAPWGLAFIQSYAVDKKLQVKDLRYERIDVIVGAVLTGVIGFFVVVACAATLHVQGIEINDAGDAARALEPSPATRRRPSSASASSAPPCSRRRSCRSPPPTRSPRPSEQGRPRRHLRGGAPFYLSYAVVVAIAAVLVLIPGAPLIPILFLSQALNAVLLLVLLPFMRSLGSDRELMGENALGRGDRIATGVALGVIAVSVLALAVLTIA